MGVEASEQPLAVSAQPPRENAASIRPAEPLPVISSSDLRHESSSWWTILFQVCFTLSLGAGMWTLVWSAVGARYYWIQGLFLPSLIILVIGLFALRNELHWAAPGRRLTRLLPLIRSGAAPIEELTLLGGGIVRVGVVDEIQNLLHDLREQRREIAKLEEEMRQRLATRTSALERQIGTLRLQASRDALTGLFNRRMFEGYLDKLIGQCRTEKIDLSVLMIDVDNFKILNDTLGHAAGDELLRSIGQLIRSGVREQDAPFRFGGDEFVIVMPGCGPPPATGLAQRLSDLVDGLARTLRVPQKPRLSIGVTALSDLDPAVTAHQMMAQADRQLYEIKAARKASRVTVNPPLVRTA
jgi:diguanylate cyclase (GGDEF)-like protein